jgi:hypothetical protein
MQNNTTEVSTHDTEQKAAEIDFKTPQEKFRAFNNSFRERVSTTLKAIREKVGLLPPSDQASVLQKSQDITSALRTNQQQSAFELKIELDEHERIAPEALSEPANEEPVLTSETQPLPLVQSKQSQEEEEWRLIEERKKVEALQSQAELAMLTETHEAKQQAVEAIRSKLAASGLDHDSLVTSLLLQEPGVPLDIFVQKDDGSYALSLTQLEKRLPAVSKMLDRGIIKQSKQVYLEEISVKKAKEEDIATEEPKVVFQVRKIIHLPGEKKKFDLLPSKKSPILDEEYYFEGNIEKVITNGEEDYVVDIDSLSIDKESERTKGDLRHARDSYGEVRTFSGEEGAEISDGSYLTVERDVLGIEKAYLKRRKFFKTVGRLAVGTAGLGIAGSIAESQIAPPPSDTKEEKRSDEPRTEDEHDVENRAVVIDKVLSHLIDASEKPTFLDDSWEAFMYDYTKPYKPEDTRELVPLFSKNDLRHIAMDNTFNRTEGIVQLMKRFPPNDSKSYLPAGTSIDAFGNTTEEPARVTYVEYTLPINPYQKRLLTAVAYASGCEMALENNLSTVNKESALEAVYSAMTTYQDEMLLVEKELPLPKGAKPTPEHIQRRNEAVQKAYEAMHSMYTPLDDEVFLPIANTKKPDGKWNDDPKIDSSIRANRLVISMARILAERFPSKEIYPGKHLVNNSLYEEYIYDGQTRRLINPEQSADCPIQLGDEPDVRSQSSN